MAVHHEGDGCSVGTGSEGGCSAHESGKHSTVKAVLEAATHLEISHLLVARFAYSLVTEP
jgi:hypothetical protein